MPYAVRSPGAMGLDVVQRNPKIEGPGGTSSPEVMKLNMGVNV